jgi:hypothetical protein
MTLKVSSFVGALSRLPKTFRALTALPCIHFCYTPFPYRSDPADRLPFFTQYLVSINKRGGLNNSVIDTATLQNGSDALSRKRFVASLVVQSTWYR